MCVDYIRLPFVPVPLFGSRPRSELTNPSPNALKPCPTRLNDLGVLSCFITSHS